MCAFRAARALRCLSASESWLSGSTWRSKRERKPSRAAAVSWSLGKRDALTKPPMRPLRAISDESNVRCKHVCPETTKSSGRGYVPFKGGLNASESALSQISPNVLIANLTPSPTALSVISQPSPLGEGYASAMSSMDSPTTRWRHSHSVYRSQSRLRAGVFPVLFGLWSLRLSQRALKVSAQPTLHVGL